MTVCCLADGRENTRRHMQNTVIS